MVGESTFVRIQNAALCPRLEGACWVMEFLWPHTQLLLPILPNCRQTTNQKEGNQVAAGHHPWWVLAFTSEFARTFHPIALTPSVNKVCHQHPLFWVKIARFLGNAVSQTVCFSLPEKWCQKCSLHKRESYPSKPPAFSDNLHPLTSSILSPLIVLHWLSACGNLVGVQ